MVLKVDSAVLCLCDGVASIGVGVLEMVHARVDSWR